MSWSISCTGTVSEVVKQLADYSITLETSPQSKAEFDVALPSLSALVEQNFDVGEGAEEPVIEFSANGHGTEIGDKPVSRVCNVSIKRVPRL